MSRGWSLAGDGHCLGDEQSSCSAHTFSTPGGVVLNTQVIHRGSDRERPCPERKRFSPRVGSWLTSPGLSRRWNRALIGWLEALLLVILFRWFRGQWDWGLLRGHGGKGPACQGRRLERRGFPPGREDPLEEDMATRSSVFPRKSHGQGSLLGCSPWGRRVRLDSETKP